MAEYTPGTPLPWQSNGSHIYGPEPARHLVGQFLSGDGRLLRDRDYAIHACNLYPELLEAAQEALRALHSASAYIASKTGTSNQHRNDTIAQLEAAIAKATDGEG